MVVHEERGTAAKVVAVWAAIAANEGPTASDEYPCTNGTIRDATGLPDDEIAAILEELWQGGRIEGILTMGRSSPYLRGIRRVLRGRPRAWGLDGWYKSHP